MDPTSTNVFWTNTGNGTIAAVPSTTDGGAAPTTVVTGQDSPNSIAVDSDALYWANSGGEVMRASQDGGAVTALATGRSDPGDIAIDDTNVY